MSVLETTIGHVAEALVVAAAQHIEEALIVRAVGRKAELMARAGQFHAAGLEDLGAALLGRVESMDAQKPLASVIPLVTRTIETVRLPESEVVEAAARYLTVVRPKQLVTARMEPKPQDDLADERPSRPPRRRSS